jgi:outer membrane biosynthesis protein TonB
MNDYWKPVATVSMIALLVIASPFSVASAETRAGTSISIGPEATDSPDGTTTLAPGETVTLTVWANATDVSGYQSEVTFDPDVVAVMGVSGTSDFDSPVRDVDNENGSVTFNQIRSGEATDPLLAQITIEVIGTDGQRSDLSFDDSETKFSNDTGGTFQPGELRSLTVTVESTTPTETATPTPTPTPTETATPTPTPTTTQTATPTQTPTTTETGTATPTETATTTATATSTPDSSSNAEGSDDNSDSSSAGGSTGGASTGGANTGGSTGGASTSGGSSGGGSASGGSTNSPPSFHVNSMRVNGTAVTVGDEVTVRAVVRNSGGDGTFTVQFTVNETSVETSEVDIDSGETRTIRFTRRLSSPGTYEFGLNGRVVGTTNVTAASTSTPSNQVTDTKTPTETDRSAPIQTTAEPTSGTTEQTDQSPGTTTTTSGAVSQSAPGFGAPAVLGALALLVSGLLLHRE